MKSSKFQAPSSLAMKTLGRILNTRSRNTGENSTTKHQKQNAARRSRPALSLALGCWCLLLSLASHSSAQNFAIDWFTIDGGGGTNTGGVYSLSGTIGQPDANAPPMTGGNFSLAGGFWSLFAVQMPGAPLLTIRLTTTNTAIVSWPSPFTGFTLQQNGDLNPTEWVAAPQTVTDNGTNRFIIVNPSAGNGFYRLFKP
jgi:hypothetical protein